MKDQVTLSDKTKLSMPIANLIGLIMIVASVVFMYSQITNRLTSLETSSLESLLLIDNLCFKGLDSTKVLLEIIEM